MHGIYTYKILVYVFMLRRINITGTRKKIRSKNIVHVAAVEIVLKENNEIYLNGDITHLIQ